MLDVQVSKVPVGVPPHPRKVLLVDDHAVVREGLSQRINAEADLNVCAQAQSTGEALQALQLFLPDVVVVDLALPGSHGLQLIKEIRSQQHPARIVVFTMYDESSFALRALRAGAHGYVTKHESSDCLLKAIRTVLNGDYAVSPEVSKMFFESSLNQPSSCVGPMDSLGDRELEVLQLMGSGIGTQQIAFQLSRSVKTIETYQARIKRKLRLKNSAELMREAVRWVEAQR